MTIQDNERQVIRDLAKKLADLANQPIMEERRKLWYAHQRPQNRPASN